MEQAERQAIIAKNLAAIMTAMKFDGDIPFDGDGSKAGKESRNQVDMMTANDEGTLFYVSLYEPHGDCEAYVWCDNKGNCSYYDFSYTTTVVNNVVVREYSLESYTDELDQLFEKFKFESGTRVDPAGIEPYLALLQTQVE